jgi:hypothetical protein
MVGRADISRKHIRLTKRITPLDGLTLSTRNLSTQGQEQLFQDTWASRRACSIRVPIHQLLWTFDVKVDDGKRARQVGGGHMTEKLDFEEATSTMIALDTVKLLFLSSQ